MKLSKAKAILKKKYGFTFERGFITGFRDAENVDTGRNHFKSYFRTVAFFESIHGGYCISSHVYGEMRFYRCRNKFKTEIAPVVVSGPTLEDAMEKFIQKFDGYIAAI